VALQPGNAAAWFNHGHLLEACGRQEDALEAFVRATTAEPGVAAQLERETGLLVRPGAC